MTDDYVRDLERMIVEMDRIIKRNHETIERIRADLPLLLLTSFTLGFIISALLSRLVHG